MRSVRAVSRRGVTSALALAVGVTGAVAMTWVSPAAAYEPPCKSTPFIIVHDPDLRIYPVDSCEVVPGIVGPARILACDIIARSTDGSCP